MTDAPSAQARMREYLQLVATGPELSKSLDQRQAEDAMAMILRRETGDVRAGIFLIALRMKRETEAENIGVLNALTKSMKKIQVSVPNLMVLADPFNGYSRGLCATPFLPSVLAACGLPTYIHGVETVGPKYGITANRILAAAGIDVCVTLDEAGCRIDSGDIGWAYVDQSQYIPELYQLVELRDHMVKRSCISTLEVVLQPISASRSTYLMTGFVHKAYPPVYASLAHHAGFDGAAIVRGVEGGCIPSLSQVSRYFSCSGNAELDMVRLSPGELGIDQTERCVAIPEALIPDMAESRYGNSKALDRIVRHNLELGLSALSNEAGRMLDSLVFGASIALKQAGTAASLVEGAGLARRAIADGLALQRFNAVRMAGSTAGQ